MNDWKLPKELQRLEDELKALPRPALPASLLTRVDHDMYVRLRSDRRRRWYAFVVAAAASALLWANVSFRVGLATDFHLTGQPKQSSVTQLEEQLHGLFPDLDVREIRRQAVMIRASSRIAPRLAGSVSATRSRQLTDIDKFL
jgi:hypothetical protein